MQTPEENIVESWDTLSGKVVATVLTDPGSIFPVIEVLGHHTEWVSPAFRTIYATMVRCIDEDLSPTPTNIAAKSGGKLSIKHLDNVSDALWTDEASRDLVANTNALRELGILFGIRSVGTSAANATDPSKIPDLLSYVELELAKIASQNSRRRGDAQAISDRAWKFEGQVLKTGLPFFDDKAGGFWTGRIHWVVARYKGGKSTMMRWLVWYFLRQGIACEVFVAEGSQEQFAIDIQTMMAVDLMLESGIPIGEIRLEPDLVTRAHVPPFDVTLTAEEVTALEFAKAEFVKFPVRAWDIADGIDDLSTLSFVTKQGKMQQGSKVVFLDYAGLFRVRGATGIYESATAVATALQKLAAKEGIAVVVLAQKNELGVKHTGKESFSANVSGGGAAPATADYLFEPNITSDPTGQSNVNVMDIKLTHSRHTRPSFGRFPIHAGSGLFLHERLRIDRVTLDAMVAQSSMTEDDVIFLGPSWNSRDEDAIIDREFRSIE